MSYFNYPFYIFFGILPSLIWLQFYLRRDVHPEPKSMILKIFFYGMLSTLPAFFLEIAIFEETEKLNLSSSLVFILNMFLGVAFIEESLKFLVVREKVLNNPEFDEPVDAMIYMIIAALGFAAAENIIIFLPLKSPLSEIFEISLFRFLGATFLHALSSGTLGFFIGLSFFKKEKRGELTFLGIIVATFLHGLYNLSLTRFDLISFLPRNIIQLGKNLVILLPPIILISMAIIVSFCFKRLRKLVKTI